MLLKHIRNLSHLVGSAVILGLTHINVTHTNTHRTRKNLQTASVQCQMCSYTFLDTKLCLNAQILTFIAYFQCYLCAYIRFVLLPC